MQLLSVPRSRSLRSTCPALRSPRPSYQKKESRLTGRNRSWLVGPCDALQLRRLKPDGLWWDEMNNSTISFFLEKSTAFVDHWLLTDLPIVAYRNHAVNAQRAIVGATSKDGVMLTKDRMHDGALIPHSQVGERLASGDSLPCSPDPRRCEVQGFLRLIQCGPWIHAAL
jgi:hypothetical protein